MRTAEDSEQVLRQPELSRAMVGTTAHQKVYRPEGKRLEPEKDSQRTGAQDTQLIDLTMEEPALLEELGSGKPTRKTGPSAITSMGMGRAERKFPGQVNWQAGDEEKEVPLRACTTKAGEGRDSVLQRQPDQRADTEESDVSDIPEWILADNQLNRSITHLRDNSSETRVNAMMGTVDQRRSLAPCSTWVVELTASSGRH